MFGLTVEEASDPPAEVWPDMVSTVNVFVAMGTQWRVGFSGPIGLDYSALPAVLRMVDVPRKEWTDVFDGLRAMESAALEHMHKEK